MRKPETVFKERIYPKLRALPKCWVEKIDQVSKRGIPDFLMCLSGQFIALELKKDDKCRPDPLQRHVMNKIDQAGGISFEVNPQNWEEIYKILKTLARSADSLDL